MEKVQSRLARAATRRSLLLGMAALGACAPRVAPTGRVRIGYQKNGVLLLAKSRGRLPSLLAAAGVSAVEWSEFGAGPPLLEAMRAGAIDLGAVGDTPPIFAQAAAAPIVYAAAQPLTGAGAGLLVAADSPVGSVAELKGRRIAFTKGSSAHLFVLEALAKAGLSLKDVTPAYLSPADAAAAFANGALDAWAIWDPFFAIAEQGGKARVLLDGRSLPPTNAFYMASRTFAKRSPKVLGAVLSALAAEAAWGNAHKAEVGAIVAAATGLPAPIVATSLRRGDFAVSPVTDAVVRAQQANADLFAQAGVIPGRINIRQAVWSGWGAVPTPT